MVSLLASRDAPSSPWAARYPLEDCNYTEGNKNHSILAPEGPRINDPKYYDQDPPPSGIGRPLTYEEIDKIFRTEFRQNDKLEGLRTWKAAVLNRYVRFTPETGWLSGGHQPIDREKGGYTTRTLPAAPRPSRILDALSMSYGPTGILGVLLDIMPTNEEKDFAVYMRERIEVDETRWLPFLRKDRWFDWIEVTEPLGSQPGKTWTVDDPKVWEILRVSLELLNRIIEALVQDKHEGETILYGRVDYWAKYVDIFGEPTRPDDTVLLSLKMERRIALQRRSRCLWDFIPGVTPKASRERLIRVHETLVWGLGDNPTTAEASSNQRPSTTFRDSYYSAMIVVSTRRLEMILNTDLTLAETCLIQVDLALTMLHELMHATISARYHNDRYIGNCLDPAISGLYPREPYLDAADVAETGHYMDQLFFGGSQFLVPPVAREAASPPIAMIIKSFPWPGCSESSYPAPNCPSLAPGAIMRTVHVPSTWASKLLSEAFWRDTEYPDKSANFFHLSSLFVSETPDGADVAKTQLRLLPTQYPGDEMVVGDWIERENLWENYRRDWWDRTESQWMDSPWRTLSLRDMCDDFAIAFEKKDIIACTNVASSLLNIIKYDADTVTYMNYLPTFGRRNPHWGFHAIGLLMTASIPRLRRPLHRGEDPGPQPDVQWSMELTPSKAASAGKFFHPVYIPRFYENYTRAEAEPIEIYDHIRRTGRIPDFIQCDCLILLDDLITYIAENEGVVHRAMLDAIVSAKDAIYVDRRTIEVAYPNRFAHASKWATSWMFKYPPYDPMYYKFGPDGKEVVS